MARKKHKPRRQPWWQRKRVRQQLTVLASLTLAVGLLGLATVYLQGRGNQHEAAQNVSGPAPAFALPTITGDEFVSADHLGKHALLLYFNEGVG